MEKKVFKITGKTEIIYTYEIIAKDKDEAAREFIALNPLEAIEDNNIIDIENDYIKIEEEEN